MADIEQSVKVALNNKFLANINNASASKLAGKLKTLLPALIIERTQAGFDIYGRKFGGYNASYNKEKAYKYAKKRYGLTSYASSSKSNKLQLTGNLFSSISSKIKSVAVTKNGINIVIQLFIAGRDNQLKAVGLQDTTGYSRGGGSYSKKSWEFFGLSFSGQFQNQEKIEIFKVVKSVLGNPSGGKISVGEL